MEKEEGGYLGGEEEGYGGGEEGGFERNEMEPLMVGKEGRLGNLGG